MELTNEYNCLLPELNLASWQDADLSRTLETPTGDGVALSDLRGGGGGGAGVPSAPFPFFFKPPGGGGGGGGGGGPEPVRVPSQCR